MPVVGFGTSKTSDPQSAVEMALNTGYRHIDCAHVGAYLLLFFRTFLLRSKNIELSAYYKLK